MGSRLHSKANKNLSGIRKTRLHNFDPLKPHFYIVKLGCTGVYIIFLISAQKHRLWVLVRVPTIYVSAQKHRLWVLVRVPTIYVFEQKYEKYQNFLSENFHFLVVKFSVYLNRRVFVMMIPSKCHNCKLQPNKQRRGTNNDKKRHIWNYLR